MISEMEDWGEDVYKRQILYYVARVIPVSKKQKKYFFLKEKFYEYSNIKGYSL